MQSDPERDAPGADGVWPPKLAKYRHMTGIHTPPVMRGVGHDRPAPNIGVYGRVVMEEKKMRFQYHFATIVINVMFLGQIIVAATLTALGASNASHIAITVLGSLNTIIAGVQTYLKGQGLPNRIEQYRFGLRKLREHIEARERDFSHEDCKLDVDHVIVDIAEMYQAVRQTAEDNSPETYKPMGGAGKRLLGKDTAGNPVVAPANAGTGGGNIPAAAANIDSMAAAEYAEAEKTKNETKDKGKAPVAEDGPSSTTPNHDAETEDAPLLQKDKADGKS